MPRIAVPSRRFGLLHFERDAIVVFPECLPGLGPSRRYVFVDVRPGSPFRWLQSADDPEVAVFVTSPWSFLPGFRCELAEEAADDIRLDAGATGIAVWVTVRRALDFEGFSANLRAPIVIHRGRGHQLINEASRAQLRAPLFADVGNRAA